jgi:probable phosphoglycerate mutase
VSRSIHVALLRHAETAWNRERRAVGRADPPLAAEGQAQVARWRLPADLVRLGDEGQLGWAASPLRRAVETAQRLGVQDLLREPRLQERDWGEWTGCSLDALEPRMLEQGWTYAPPGGESAAAVLARVRSWLADLAAADGPATWIAVTHRGVIQIVLAAAVGWNLRSPAPFRLLAERVHRIRHRGDGHLQLLSLNEPLTAL